MVGPVKRRSSKTKIAEPIIDEDFRSRIPPLTPDETKFLEESIIAEGCRDPLVVWCDRLVDGHHRLEICRRNKVPYKTVELHRTDRKSVEDWIDRNQLGRRNLHPDVASLLRGRIFNREKQKVGRPRTDPKMSQSETIKNSNKSDTSTKLADKFGVSRATVNRDGVYAEAVDGLKAIAPELEVQVIRGEGPPRKLVVEAAKVAQESPKKAKEILASKPHVTRNSGENEWYTPAEYITAAKEVMGGIDVDPASSAEANETVGAKAFFDIDTDGLTKEWHGRIWLNPPYILSLVSRFCAKLISEYLAKRTTEAIVLVNNASETSWYQDLAGFASAICSPKGRIKYRKPGGNTPGIPIQGQSLFYLGPNVERFAQYFSVFGIISYPVQQDLTAAPPPMAQPPSPEPYLEAAKTAMGDDVVMKTDEFDEPWEGMICFHPPQTCDQEQEDNLCAKLTTHIMLQEVSEAIAIVVCDAGSQRFSLMSKVSSAICFPKNTPYTVFYFGTDPKAFVKRFSEFGEISVGFRAYQIVLKKLAFAEDRLNDLEAATARMALIQAGAEDKEKHD